jgi:hypothetical protein
MDAGIAGFVGVFPGVTFPGTRFPVLSTFVGSMSTPKTESFAVTVATFCGGLCELVGCGFCGTALGGIFGAVNATVAGAVGAAGAKSIVISRAVV